MSSRDEGLSREEFYNGLQALSKAMDSGFGGINARLDRLNGKTEAHGKDIVRLETLLDERERAANKDTTARLGGFVGAVVGGVALVWQWMGK